MKTNLAYADSQYIDKEQAALDFFEEKAKHTIREELMNDDAFVAETAMQSFAGTNFLQYIAKAARGEHDARAARKVIAFNPLFGELCPEEEYLLAAADERHDTARAAKIKADLVEATVEAKWKELALTFAKAAELYDGEDL